MNFYVADRIANLGANVFIVDRFGIITSQDAWVKAQKRPLITMDDYERLRDSMKRPKQSLRWTTTTSRSAPEMSAWRITDVMGSPRIMRKSATLTLRKAALSIRPTTIIVDKSFFIGADVADRLFANVDPIGKVVRAETHEYQVIGVAERIGSAFGHRKTIHDHSAAHF